MRVLRLYYQRSEESFELVHGILEVRRAERRELEFKGIKFNEMMALVSKEVLADLEIDSVVIYRTDRPGLRPVKLDDRTFALMRSDPAAAIRSMNVDPITVNIGNTPTKTRSLAITDKALPVDVVELSPIPSGYAVLAETFGEQLFLRRQGDKVECPFTGRWVGVLWEVGGYGYIQDTHGINCRVTAVTEEWFSIQIQTLLESNEERFFLPRAWNMDVWIDHKTLALKYEDFKKERNQCLERLS